MHDITEVICDHMLSEFTYSTMDTSAHMAMHAGLEG